MIGRSSQESGVRSQNWLLWIGGYCALPILAIVAALMFLSGCSSVQRDPPLEVWDDMKRQGKFKPQMENTIFPDRRDSRVPPDGTVARGHLNEDATYYTGMVGEMYVGRNPAFDKPNVIWRRCSIRGTRDSTRIARRATIVRGRAADRAHPRTYLAARQSDGGPRGAVCRRGDFQRGQ